MNLRRKPFFWLAAPAAELAYIAAFPFFTVVLGRLAGVIPNVGIVAVALFLGMRAAVAAAVVAIVANAMLYVDRGDGEIAAIVTGAAISGVSLAFAWGVNRLR